MRISAKAYTVEKITVRLFVESDHISVESISESIGLDYDSCWRIGDRRGRTDKLHFKNSWRLESIVDIGDQFDEIADRMNAALNQVLDRLAGREDRFRDVAAKAESGVLVGITASHVPAIILNASTLQRLTALALDLEIDLVLVGEPFDKQGAMGA